MWDFHPHDESSILSRATMNKISINDLVLIKDCELKLHDISIKDKSSLIGKIGKVIHIMDPRHNYKFRYLVTFETTFTAWVHPENYRYSRYSWDFSEDQLELIFSI